MGAIQGGIIGICGALAGIILNNFLEEKRRKKMIVSINARERLEKLYIPLIDHIEKSTPLDEFNLDDKGLSDACNMIDKNILFASHNLMEQFYYITGPHAYHDENMGWGLYRVICKDYNELLDVAGLGDIKYNIRLQSILDNYYSRIKRRASNLRKKIFSKQKI